MPFTPAALRFFRQLAAHNDKQWFEAHRTEYETEVRERADCLAACLHVPQPRSTVLRSCHYAVPIRAKVSERDLRPML